MTELVQVLTTNLEESENRAASAERSLREERVKCAHLEKLVEKGRLTADQIKWTNNLLDPNSVDNHSSSGR